MPDEYISRRDARIAILEKQAGGGLDQKITVGSAEAVINAVPAADVAPVVHGQWDISKGPLGDMCKCSACGSLPSLPTKFCPYCGARMDMDGTAE